MRPEGVLVAERPLAQHSERLVKRTPGAGEVGVTLGAALPRIEHGLADALADLIGARPKVACAKVERTSAARLHKLVDAVAVNCMLAEAGTELAVLSLGHSDALMLTDQVFGGPGARVGLRPERLSGAADRIAGRLVQLVGEALASAFDRSEPLQPAAHSEVLGKFVSASDPGEFFLLAVTVSRGGQGDWGLRLILRPEQAARLLRGAPRPGGPAPGGDSESPETGRFAEVAMPLTAVVAEIRAPVARIARLAPGDVLPLATSGQARLRIEEVDIARGQIGAADGQLALRLTHIAWTEKRHGNDG